MPSREIDEFNDLMHVLKRNYKRLMALDGVHRADIGFKYKDSIRTNELALRVHVYQKNERKLLKSSMMPKRIEGKIADVMENTPINNSREGEPFPVIEGGIEIANIHIYGNGTLGGVFEDHLGNVVGLTNHHVLLGNRGSLNQPISQPYLRRATERDIIGTVLDYSADFDCAILKLNNRRDYTPSIYDLTNFMSDVVSIPRPGIPVVKSGVKTEITYGVVDGVTIDNNIFIKPNPAKSNSDNKLSDGGDSGSIWMLDEGNRDMAVCLHTEGSLTFDAAQGFSMKKVMSVLNIKFIK